MKKLSIKVLISVMVLAAIGLIGIQLYWMDTFEQNRSLIFDSTVQSALNNVQRKLETREAERFTEQKINVKTDQFKNLKTSNAPDQKNKNKTKIEKLRKKYLEGKAVLGVDIRDIDGAMAEKFNLESVRGVYVEKVFRLSPAFHAGLQKGDIITEINGKQIVSVFEFMTILDKLKKDTQIDLTFERLNNDDQNWLSKCKAIDDLHYDIFDDSIRIRYSLHIQDCENPSDYKGYQLIIDSTNKYSQISITDTSTKQELLSYTYNRVHQVDEKNPSKNIQIINRNFMVQEKDHLTFSTVEPLEKFKKYMSDDSIPNEIKIEQALAFEVINEQLDNESLVQYAMDLMNKKAAASYKSIEERLSKFDLSKMIHEELAIQGVDQHAEWGIIEYSTEVLFSKDYKLYENLKTYSTPLFPNDLKRKPMYLTVRFPENNPTIASLLCAWMFPLLAFLFLSIIAFCFGYTVNTIIKQKKLSELTTDFINNMTHELKTPVSTIKLASEMLLDESVPVESNARFIKIIQDENQRLGSQIERVLQIAKIDKDKSKLKLEHLNVHEILEDVMEHSLLQIEQKNGQLAYEFNSSQPVIEADRVHLTNIFNNLLDNAIKYTPQLPKLKVSTEDTEEGIVISFKDNGIGMNKEAQKKIFDKFYRVPTGNLHNVKGFGLGLAYVKLITEAHGGNISVISKPNQGSLFQLFLPKNNTEYNII